MGGYTAAAAAAAGNVTSRKRKGQIEAEIKRINKLMNVDQGTLLSLQKINSTQY